MSGKSCARKQDKIELIVAYGGFLGLGTRPVAVPIEVVGIPGRQLASLDMPREGICGRADMARHRRCGACPSDDSIRIALARR